MFLTCRRVNLLNVRTINTESKNHQKDDVNDDQPKKGHMFLTCHRVNLINVRKVDTKQTNNVEKIM